MTPATALLVVATIAGVVAVALLTTSPGPAAPARRPAPPDGSLRRWTGAVAAAAVAVAFSGWVLSAMVVGAATWFTIRGWQRRDRRAGTGVERTDALASWIENLRDVLIAGDQPIGAITATVSTCPDVIRPAVRRLAAGLGHRDPADAFRQFADEIDDPLGDLVAAGLLIAVQRGARTSAVLTSLADQARRQADRRRLLEAERAPVRREVMLLALVMGALMLGLLVFGRAEYLEPYDVAGGQLFLGVVLSIYALLLLRVQRLSQFPSPSRFLTGAAPSGRGAPTDTPAAPR